MSIRLASEREASFRQVGLVLAISLEIARQNLIDESRSILRIRQESRRPTDLLSWIRTELIRIDFWEAEGEMMGWSRHTEAQIVAALKQVEAGRTVDDVARECGVSQATIYKWKAKFGGTEVREARRLHSLEDENSRLKQLVADLSLDNEMPTGREAVQKGASTSDPGAGIWSASSSSVIGRWEASLQNAGRSRLASRMNVSAERQPFAEKGAASEQTWNPGGTTAVDALPRPVRYSDKA